MTQNYHYSNFGQRDGVFPGLVKVSHAGQVPHIALQTFEGGAIGRRMGDAPISGSSPRPA